MGVLTNTELLALVRAGLGGRSDNDTLLIQSINMGQQLIARLTDYDELQALPINVTLTADQNYFDLSDIITAGSHQSYNRVHKIYSFTIISGSSYRPIQGLTRKQWEKKVPSDSNTDTTSTPTLYTRIKDRIYLYSTPSSAFELRCAYSLWPTDLQHSSGVLTTGTDPGQASATSDLEEKDDLILTSSKLYFYLLNGNEDKANYFWSVFNSHNNLATEDYRLEDVMNGIPSGGGGANSKEQVDAPSAGALSGTDSWDGSYRSTPGF